MRLLISGGGTGGHLYPALAVARAFRAEEPDGALLLVGRSGGPEERLVPAAGFDLATVNVRGLDRDAVWKNIALPAIIPTALRAGLRIVDRFRPDVVLGMGGYVMAPAVAAARIRGIPYVLLAPVEAGAAERPPPCAQGGDVDADALAPCCAASRERERLVAAIQEMSRSEPLQQAHARRPRQKPADHGWEPGSPQHQPDDLGRAG